MASVLLIDDSPTIAHFVRISLALDGHAVQVPRSFVTLAADVARHPPDLVLLDLGMPALSGVTVGLLLREHLDPATPIVVYSSRTPEELLEAARTVGARGFLQKNGSVADLRAMVARALRVSHRPAHRA